MKYLTALAMALALAACNQQTPAQSQATPSADAPAATSTDGPEEIDPNSAEGQARLREIVTGYLDMAQGQLAANGQRDPGLPDQLALINVSESPNNWAVNLNAGVDYVFFGACDHDCSNLDIELIDGSNAVVASDVAPDDFPIVRYTPSAAGPFTVRTHLRTCAVEPCQIGVRAVTE
jgi:hypothetical protein